jgi:hypothetical protein
LQQQNDDEPGLFPTFQAVRWRADSAPVFNLPAAPAQHVRDMLAIAKQYQLVID